MRYVKEDSPNLGFPYIDLLWDGVVEDLTVMLTMKILMIMLIMMMSMTKMMMMMMIKMMSMRMMMMMMIGVVEAGSRHRGLVLRSTQQPPTQMVSLRVESPVHH